MLRLPSALSMAIALLSASAALSANAQSPSEDLMSGYQSATMTSGSFGREPGRNGLQSPGSLSISVEAISGNIKDSNALIGSDAAPQIFGDRFYATSLYVID